MPHDENERGAGEPTIMKCRYCGALAVSSVWAVYMNAAMPCVQSTKSRPGHTWLSRKLEALQQLGDPSAEEVDDLMFEGYCVEIEYHGEVKARSVKPFDSEQIDDMAAMLRSIFGDGAVTVRPLLWDMDLS